MIKCLVTGGSGFIGSNLVDGLLAQGYEVRVLDNLSTGKKENLAHVMDRIEFFEGDIRNEEDCHNAMKGITFVFHLAACRAVARSVDDPKETNDVNVNGILNLLMAARDAGVRRFVFSSSSSAYGDSDVYPSKEDAKPAPISPYAATKVMGEYYCQLFHKLYGLETVAIRYFNVFGPRQNPESKYSAVIPLFIDCLSRGVSPEIHWDGKQSRDFTFVTNVVLGNILAAETPAAAGETFNIACHGEHSILDIFNAVRDLLKVDVLPTFKPKRAGDIRRSFADISKAERILGYRPIVGFHEGIEETVSWFCKEYSRVPAANALTDTEVLKSAHKISVPGLARA